MGITLTKAMRLLKSQGVGAVLKRSTQRVIDLRRTRKAVLAKPQFASVDALLDFTLGKPAAFISPFQVRCEIKGILEMVQGLRPKMVLEIGTANGGTLFLWTRVSADDAELVSLDLPGGSFGDGYPEWKSPLYLAFALAGQKIHLLRDDSHAQRSLDSVKRIIGDRPIDFLFIDGDHTYDGVRADFEMYSPLVRKGGLVGFHDIATHPDANCQVSKFWNEVKTRYPAREFIESPTQGWAGIGVITIT